MQKNTKLFLLVLIVILAVSASVLLLNKKKPDYKPGVSPDQDRMVNQAQAIYQAKKAAGVDFSAGPCLTNDLAPDWVVDTVHNPRQPIDDLPANQCQAFREGRAHHFVELDLDGNVVRIQ